MIALAPTEGDAKQKVPLVKNPDGSLGLDNALKPSAEFITRIHDLFEKGGKASFLAELTRNGYQVDESYFEPFRSDDNEPLMINASRKNADGSNDILTVHCRQLPNENTGFWATLRRCYNPDGTTEKFLVDGEFSSFGQIQETLVQHI